MILTLWKEVANIFTCSTKNGESTEKNNNTVAGSRSSKDIKFSTRQVEVDYSLIKRFEGFRKSSYICPGGKITIGSGITRYHTGKKVKLGETITKEQNDFEIDWYCKNKIDLSDLGKLNANQKSALCTLIFNIGQPNFNRSTVKKRIKENDTKENISEAWKRWNKVGKKTLKGLVRRREAEVKLYFKGV